MIPQAISLGRVNRPSACDHSPFTLWRRVHVHAALFTLVERDIMA